MCIASCRNVTPSMRGMRWSASSKATLSLRTFSCFNRSNAPSGESLPMTRYSAPYCERKSRSIARRTSESSSTLSKIGLGTFRSQLDIESESHARSRCKLARFDLVHIAPDPAFSRLDRTHKRVFRVVKVLGGMLVLGRVATGRMSADEAHTQVNPRIAGLNAVFTHMLVGLSYFDLIKVSAFFRHRFLPLFTNDKSNIKSFRD